MIRFTVTGARRKKIACVETISVDSLYNMRDQIHADLEPGEFGGEFPIFLSLYEPDEVSAENVGAWQKELETIAKAYKKMPPEPQMLSGQTYEKIEAGEYKPLYDVYRDAKDKPLLGSLIDLCKCAKKEKLPITME